MGRKPHGIEIVKAYRMLSAAHVEYAFTATHVYSQYSGIPWRCWNITYQYGQTDLADRVARGIGIEIPPDQLMDIDRLVKVITKTENL